jgi:hypothetical protein
MTGPERLPRARSCGAGHGDGAAVLLPLSSQVEPAHDAIARCLAEWPHPGNRIYIGCHRTDHAAIAAAMDASKTGAADRRVRIVFHVLAMEDAGCRGLDCLGLASLFDALSIDEARRGATFDTLAIPAPGMDGRAPGWRCLDRARADDVMIVFARAGLQVPAWQNERAFPRC